LEINTWHFENTKSLQIDTNCFSNFLGTQHQAPDKVHSLVVIFVAKTELALFKNQVATDWFIFFLALQNGSAQPLQKNLKKNIILVPFLGVDPRHFVEEIPRGILRQQYPCSVSLRTFRDRERTL
jgi:hypothetical protein